MSNPRITTFAVNANNDLYLDKYGNIVIVEDLTAVLQICQQVAQVRLGEIALNTDEGIPFFETVWNGVPNIAQFENALRTAFLNVTGVLQVVSLGAVQEGRNLNYTAVIQTIYGTGAISGGSL